MSETTKVYHMHLTMEPSLVRSIDTWAAEEDLYRNQAIVRLIAHGLNINDQQEVRINSLESSLAEVKAESADLRYNLTALDALVSDAARGIEIPRHSRPTVTLVENLKAESARLREALVDYMSQFGQALEAHGISFGPAQQAAHEHAAIALAPVRGEETKE